MTALIGEINMTDRKFTWSNERGHPTLELLDRVFSSSEWLLEFPNHVLRPLSSDSSDHCPLLLQLNVLGESKRRFRFESFWVRLPGFCDVVANAWTSLPPQSDPFRTVDAKLRNVAKALTSWSASNIGSVRLQLTLAREAILCFDIEQERRTLQPWEFELRHNLKLKVLGVASLLRTIARQRSRILFLAEGDANTRFYHQQACHRSRQNQIRSLNVQGQQVLSDRAMADALYDYYNDILGSNFERSRRLNLQAIGLPSAMLHHLETLFTVEEV